MMQHSDDTTPENSIFAKIVAGQIPATVVLENEHVIAFRDIQPQAPSHVLIIPKRAVRDIMGVDPETLQHLFVAAQQVARQEGLEETGFRIVVNTGHHGGQSVFYLHVHVLGGRPLSWPPG